MSKRYYCSTFRERWRRSWAKYERTRRLDVALTSGIRTAGGAGAWPEPQNTTEIQNCERLLSSKRTVARSACGCMDVGLTIRQPPGPHGIFWTDAHISLCFLSWRGGPTDWSTAWQHLGFAYDTFLPSASGKHSRWIEDKPWAGKRGWPTIAYDGNKHLMMMMMMIITSVSVSNLVPDECCSDAAWKKDGWKSIYAPTSWRKKVQSVWKADFLNPNSSDADAEGWWPTRPTKLKIQSPVSLEWD